MDNAWISESVSPISQIIFVTKIFLNICKENIIHIDIFVWSSRFWTFSKKFMWGNIVNDAIIPDIFAEKYFSLISLTSKELLVFSSLTIDRINKVHLVLSHTTATAKM